MPKKKLIEKLKEAAPMFGHGDRKLLERIECLERQILEILVRLNLPTSLKLTQGDFMPITGTPVGGSSVFQESFVPSNAALPAGAVLTVVWTVDDPKVTLTPSADGTSVTAAVDPTDTGTSYNLTATGTSAALPGPITGTANVPIIPVAPPLPTGLAINQLS